MLGVDGVWLVHALVLALAFVLASLLMSGLDAVERLDARVLPSLPRLLLGATAVLFSMFLFLPAFLGDPPFVAVALLTLCGSLLVIVGAYWIRKAVFRILGNGDRTCRPADRSR